MRVFLKFTTFTRGTTVWHSRIFLDSAKLICPSPKLYHISHIILSIIRVLTSCSLILHCAVLNHFSCVQLFVTLGFVACQAPLPWDSLGKNTRVDCHALLQGIFPTFILCFTYSFTLETTIYGCF